MPTITKRPTAPITAWKKATSIAEKSISAYFTRRNMLPQRADKRTSRPSWRGLMTNWWVGRALPRRRFLSLVTPLHLPLVLGTVRRLRTLYRILTVSSVHFYVKPHSPRMVVVGSSAVMFLGPALSVTNQWISASQRLR